MQVKTKAIVISTVRYQEKSLIVKCFTYTDGIKSYFVSNAFSTKKSNQKIAYFQPLTLLEIDAVHKNNGKLEYFKEIKLATPYQSISTDIIKSTIAIFVSEILHYAIKEEEKNEDLFIFLEAALLWLDTHNETANFHLILLIEISKFLGFYPENSFIDQSFFDAKEGQFTTFQNLNCFTEHETFLLKRLIGLKFDGNQKIFNANERQILLKCLLHYFTLHLDGFVKPKSLEVLREVFS
jgi:DNA repair protein RecO (recombination protein O)